MVIPNYDVFSGGVERTVKLLEYSDTADVRYIAYLPAGGVPNPEVARTFEDLERAGKVMLRTIGRGNGHAYDVTAVPTEYWWQAWKRARGARMHGPFCFDFHQLPYIGTLDLLKSIGIENPGLADLVRFPLVQLRAYADGIMLSAFQTIASVATVRSFSRLQDGHLMAVTPVVKKNLESLGYRGPAFIPAHPNAVERKAIEPILGTDEDIVYDGIYVGRLHPHKGILDLPHVVAHLKRIAGRDVNVAVCGSTHFARHRNRFEGLVRSLGIEKNVTVLGRIGREELYRTIRRSRTVLYPSYVDGFSITVLESLCLGVPVVAYNIDALEMIWSRRHAVFRSRVGDPKALAEAAAPLLEDDRLAEVRRLARAQTPELLREYAWSNVAQDERRFYESALEGRGAAA